MKNWRRNAALAAMPTLTQHPVRTPWREFWCRFRRQTVALISAGFVLLLIFLAVFAPGLPPLMQKIILIMAG